MRSPAGATKATNKARGAWLGAYFLCLKQFQLDGEVGTGKHMNRDSEAHMLTH